MLPFESWRTPNKRAETSEKMCLSQLLMNSSVDQMIYEQHIMSCKSVRKHNVVLYSETCIAYICDLIIALLPYQIYSDVLCSPTKTRTTYLDQYILRLLLAIFGSRLLFTLSVKKSYAMFLPFSHWFL